MSGDSDLVRLRRLELEARAELLEEASMTDEQSHEQADEPENATIKDLAPESRTVPPFLCDPSKIGRQANGRFAAGNNANPTGRPIGSKHKATLVTLRHRGIPDDPMGRRHEEGWTYVLGALVERFGAA